MIGTYYDITDRKRAEEEKVKLEGQLQHAMKMEAVGTLAGGIAHDFNNILTGILGFGELLRDKVARNEQALHDLDEILRCAERAAMLTRQLLSFARRQVIDPVNMNLSTLVADLMKAYFPAIEAQPDAFTEKRREEIIRGGKETILLAEDEEAIRSFIVRSLEVLGYNVLVARNGEEAIDIFGRNKEIALAVLDVVMPRKGGAEAFKEMHKRNPRLKVIFMSGYSADTIHDSFVLIPGMPLLQKPFGPMTLAKKVRETLDA